MIFNKTQGKFLHRVINQWADEETIPRETADLLRQSFSIRPFDWKKLAKYSFWIAIACFVIALGSVLADRALLALLARLFQLSDALRSLGLALFAAGAFYLGLSRRRAEKIWNLEFLGRNADYRTGAAQS
jgi:hypothetical protein